MFFCIIYASKGKSTKEIANTIEYWTRNSTDRIACVNLTEPSNLSVAISYAKEADAMALGSPTYGNGQAMCEMEDFIKEIRRQKISLVNKHIMLFGACGWGSCESVDYLFQECKSFGANIFMAESLPGHVGLRMHTQEILSERKIVDYITSFFASFGHTLLHQPVEFEYLSLEVPNGYNQSIMNYRKRLCSTETNGASFENCQFIHFNFSKSVFEQMVFKNCIFWYSSFESSTLRNIVFENCDLTNCSFKEAVLFQVKLINSDISESNLSGCDLLYANIDSVRMDNVVFNENTYFNRRQSKSTACVIEKHEKEHNYFAAERIHTQLYSNAKRMEDHQASDLFYFRMMENRRKLFYMQSVFYGIYYKTLHLFLNLTTLLHLKHLSLKLNNLVIRKGTQLFQKRRSGNTLRYLLLLILKILTGYRNSIVRLIKFSFYMVIASSIILFFLAYKNSNPNAFLILATNCLRQSLLYIFGIGKEVSINTGPLGVVVIYIDGFIGIIINSLFAYILIEKLMR